MYHGAVGPYYRYLRKAWVGKRSKQKRYWRRGRRRRRRGGMMYNKIISYRKPKNLRDWLWEDLGPQAVGAVGAGIGGGFGASLGRNISQRGLMYIRRWIGGNTELKYLDYAIEDMTINPDSASSSPISKSVGWIENGTLYNQRVGHSVRIVSLMVRGLVKANQSGSDMQYVRVAIVYDSQGNLNAQYDGTPPTHTRPADNVEFPASYNFSDIFWNADEVYPTTRSGLNLDRSPRFKVLWQKRFSLPKSTSTNNFEQEFNVFLKPNMVLKYENAYSYNTLKNIWIFAHSDSATNAPKLDLEYRIRFYDD